MTADPAMDCAMGAAEVAIVGGGISGLSAAYELRRLGVPFQLFEATPRLGGAIATRDLDGFLIECGPDSWVAEKPWARELATELGMGDRLVRSNDALRRTYLVRDGRGGKRKARLVPIPAGMRLIAPVSWGPFLRSPLFGWGPAGWKTKLNYLLEPGRADELKKAAQHEMSDDTVAEFVTRHFGAHAAELLAAPLLSGILGGDIHTLSTRAVLPSFARLEREHGSIITPLRERRRNGPQKALFCAPAAGMEALVEALVSRLPEECLHRGEPIEALAREGARWRLKTPQREQRFRALMLATPVHVTRSLLQPLGPRGHEIALLLPPVSSSAVVVALGFHAEKAALLRVPVGFGLLFPQSEGNQDRASLLACTFVEQKFPGRAPGGSVLLRAFFGGAGAEAALQATDDALIAQASHQLGPLLSDNGFLPDADVSLVHRLPRSLPQYLIGHAGRMAQLADTLKKTPSLALIGNAYHGVSISDLIHDSRAAARRLAAVGTPPAINQ